MQVTGRDVLPEHRAHWGKLVLVWIGIATAAAVFVRVIRAIGARADQRHM